MSTPVSCIMPTTASRSNFIPVAIQNFMRQDYPNAELIIVADGDCSIQQLIPAKGNIRYIHHAERFPTIGSKRNFACRQSSGNIILHWDDDDWYAPGWISRQVQFLEESKVAVCGLKELYFHDPALMKSWQYQYTYNASPWVAGATLAYRREAWEAYPFREMNVGEDNDFVWHSGNRLLAHTYTEGFVSMLHTLNTSPKYTEDAQWKPIDTAVIRSVMQADFERYHT